MQIKMECEFMGDTKKPEARPQIHPFTDLHLTSDSSPLVIEKGEGIYLFDSSGANITGGFTAIWFESSSLGLEIHLAAMCYPGIECTVGG